MTNLTFVTTLLTAGMLAGSENATLELPLGIKAHEVLRSEARALLAASGEDPDASMFAPRHNLARPSEPGPDPAMIASMAKNAGAFDA